MKQKNAIPRALAVWFAALLLLAGGAAFAIAPVWQPGYSPAAYQPAVLPQPAQATPPAEPVNVNTASLGQLKTLPGIGDAKAQAILDYRAVHGAFTAVEELARVPGISETMVRDWGTAVCVE